MRITIHESMTYSSQSSSVMQYKKNSTNSITHSKINQEKSVYILSAACLQTLSLIVTTTYCVFQLLVMSKLACGCVLPTHITTKVDHTGLVLFRQYSHQHIIVCSGECLMFFQYGRKCNKNFSVDVYVIRQNKKIKNNITLDLNL